MIPHLNLGLASNHSSIIIDGMMLVEDLALLFIVVFVPESLGGPFSPKLS